MKANDIKDIILKKLSIEEVHVSLNNDHYQIIVIDPILSAISMLEAHKIIYAPLVEYISNNLIHAVSINVFHPEEWNRKRRLFNL